MGQKPNYFCPHADKMSPRIIMCTSEKHWERESNGRYSYGRNYLHWQRYWNAELMAGFKAAMAKTEANYDFIQLPGALHGFSNPVATTNGQKYGLPLAYNALADESSWAHMRLTFEAVFKDEKHE